jgi:hypothetical protein
MKLDPYLMPYIKINSKWINYLNTRPETIKPQEDHIQKNLDFRLGNNCFGYDTKSRGNKSNSR